MLTKLSGQLGSKDAVLLPLGGQSGKADGEGKRRSPGSRLGSRATRAPCPLPRPQPGQRKRILPLEEGTQWAA